MSCGIYKITNIKNNKSYIGQSVDIERRWKEHIAAVNTDKKNSLYRALRKYGIDNFSFNIIELCSQNLLDEREIYWIKYYKSYNSGYNETIGGQGVIKKKKYINKQEIYYLWDKGLTVGEIAYELHRASSTIRKYLKDYPNYSPEEGRKRGRWLQNRNQHR